MYPVTAGPAPPRPGERVRVEPEPRWWDAPEWVEDADEWAAAAEEVADAIGETLPPEPRDLFVKRLETMNELRLLLHHGPSLGLLTPGVRHHMEKPNE